MNRAQLEHVIRASAAISGDDEIVVVGSQSILGQFSSPPLELCVSNEADVYPKNKPEMADVIDGAIVAGRPKDHEFVADAVRHHLVQRDELLRRLADLPVDDAQRAHIQARIIADAKRHGPR